MTHVSHVQSAYPPCILIHVYRRFGGTRCLHLQGRSKSEELGKQDGCMQYGAWAGSQSKSSGVVT
jgi:hypothetical protein